RRDTLHAMNASERIEDPMLTDYPIERRIGQRLPGTSAPQPDAVDRRGAACFAGEIHRVLMEEHLDLVQPAAETRTVCARRHEPGERSPECGGKRGGNE